jgi:hypothetical protein
MMKKLLAKLKKRQPTRVELLRQRTEAEVLCNKAVAERDQLKTDIALVRAQHVLDLHELAVERDDARTDAENWHRKFSEADSAKETYRSASRRAEALGDKLLAELLRWREFPKLTEDALRALVLQLRVFQMQDSKNRVGYGVTVFIPNEAVAALKARPDQMEGFKALVMNQALELALRGIFHVNSRGNVSALVFGMPGVKGPVCGAVFDVDGEHGMALPTHSKSIDPTIRHIENAILADQQGRPEPKLDWEKFLKDDAAAQDLEAYAFGKRPMELPPGQ